MVTITLKDFLNNNSNYNPNMKVLAYYMEISEYFNLSYLIDTCEEQNIDFSDVIITY